MESVLSYLSVAWGAALFALCPICLVVLSALFTYEITVESGAMARIRSGFATVSDDRRVLALLIVWGMGTFMEGMAGFGTAVAIPASILVGIGFDPVKSVLMCLVANTTPTVFGSVGVPTLTLAHESGCDQAPLFVTSALIHLPAVALCPLLVVLIAGGWRGLKGMWGYIIAVDVAFIVPWVLAACCIGCELPDTLGGIAVMATVWFMASRGRGREKKGSGGQLLAWAPFGLVVVTLVVAAFLPQQVKRYVPVGVMIIFAAFCGGRMQGLGFGRMARVLLATLLKYKKAFLTITSVLVFVRLLDHAGAIALFAEWLVDVTGKVYPFIATSVGAFGGLATGSGTNSCVLFGGLQVGAAKAIGVSPTLLAATNLLGAGIGKMVSPQSIAIGVAAAGLGADGVKTLVGRLLPYFAALLALASVVTGVASLFLV